MAEEASKRKHIKYAAFETRYTVRALAFETLGPFSLNALEVTKSIGRRIRSKTGEPRSTTFVRQLIPIAIQKGNALAILGTFPQSSSLEEMFYLTRHSGETIGAI